MSLCSQSPDVEELPPRELPAHWRDLDVDGKLHSPSAYAEAIEAAHVVHMANRKVLLLQARLQVSN